MTTRLKGALISAVLAAAFIGQTQVAMAQQGDCLAVFPLTVVHRQRIMDDLLVFVSYKYDAIFIKINEHQFGVSLCTKFDKLDKN